MFNITEDGLITADTLCDFVEFPRGATHLVGDKYQVRTLIDLNVCQFSWANVLIVYLILQLKCSAKGNTKPQYRWMKDGRFVSNWNDFGDYVMEHVTEEHQGGYSCLASSSAGLLQSSVAYMTVNGEKRLLVALASSLDRTNQSVSQSVNYLVKSTINQSFIISFNPLP